MSGGFFDYQQYRLGYIADAVEQLIRDNNSQELNDWGDPKGRGYSDETIDEFKRGADLLNQALIYAQRIDWLVSGDDGEDTFHARLAEDLKMANLNNTDHETIWEILENFDFARVHSVMEFLGWTWHKHFPDKPEQVYGPDVNQLRTEARRRLISAIEWARDNEGKQYLSSSGGFEVTVEIDEWGKAWVSLKFILTDWDNYE